MKGGFFERLRSLAGTRELILVALAAVIGVIAGLVVIAMNSATQALHELLFRIPAVHLSITPGVAPLLVLAVPTLGGLVFGLVFYKFFARSGPPPVDPIEANALHGGRMSARDSLLVAVQTVASSGVGASVGTEAGYTQAAGGLASKLGQRLGLKRAELRLLVGCGAGAAIGAAFDAPLMGAFYGFELVLGTYAIPAFVPMMTASFTAALTRRLVQPVPLPPLPDLGSPGIAELPSVLLLGFLCALIGIVVMRGVTLVEAGFRRSHLPAFLRPAIGGMVVGTLALGSPAVFSAGHGAVHHYIVAEGTLPVFLMLLAGKVMASSVSIGAGFRGGLFFASLLMGVFAGRAYAAGLDLVFPDLAITQAFHAVIGMSAVAVAVVGGPMTMTLLALEMTGDLQLTLAVLAAAGVASLATRLLFGFSFATWRFHLRGEDIRGAHDIGWLREMTVARLMRQDVAQFDAATTLTQARQSFPPGTNACVVATEDGRYAGLVPPAILYDTGLSDGALRLFLAHPDDVLRPEMTVREALDVFERTEAEALAVIDGGHRVVGTLGAAQAARRYSEEMARRLGEFTGERPG